MQTYCIYLFSEKIAELIFAQNPQNLISILSKRFPCFRFLKKNVYNQIEKFIGVEEV